MELIELIKTLSEADAPSGFEEPAAVKITELITPYADEVTRDIMGNVTAVLRSGREGAGKLMLCAHMDEVGFVITGQEKGFLRFAAVGGVDSRVLPAGIIKILADEPVLGVVSVLPPHVLEAGDSDKSLEIDKLYIDAGLSAEEAEEKFPPGTPAVFGAKFQRLGGDRISAKALDDRACCAIIIKAIEYFAENRPETDVYALFSAQEELGMRGAKTGAFAIAPDLCAVLDVTHANTPDSKPEETMKTDGGAAIGVGPNFSRRLSKRLLDIAAEKKIPHQTEVLPGSSGTDAWAIQVSREGIETALISLPVKYMHSPVETMSLGDAQSVLDLLREFVYSVGEEL